MVSSSNDIFPSCCNGLDSSGSVTAVASTTIGTHSRSSLLIYWVLDSVLIGSLLSLTLFLPMFHLHVKLTHPLSGCRSCGRLYCGLYHHCLCFHLEHTQIFEWLPRLRQAVLFLFGWCSRLGLCHSRWLYHWTTSFPLWLLYFTAGNIPTEDPFIRTEDH